MKAIGSCVVDGWESISTLTGVNTGLQRLEVSGGWLYRDGTAREGGMTFVPAPKAPYTGTQLA